MNKLVYLFAALFLISCTGNQEEKNVQQTVSDSTRTQSKDFQAILDSANVEGAILVYDPQTRTWHSNNFEHCSKGFLPASTFKIPNSLIALETGIVENDSTVFKWNGEKRNLPVWEQDLTFAKAFSVSCVPCYQEVARKIGAQRMRKYLDLFNYGHMVFDSTTIDLFWLEGESKISQFEQIDFLQRFYNKKLPISENTFNIMKRVLLIDNTEGYSLNGKTGWTVRNNMDIGWFVGYIEKGGKVFFVATNIQPTKTTNIDMFAKIRTDISLKAFEKLGFI